MMLLYLARHAQTASSAVDSFNGRRELPLTERGQQQARKLGQRLSAVRFAAVYRSPPGRAGQTAPQIPPLPPGQGAPGPAENAYGDGGGAWPGEGGRQGPGPYASRVRDRHGGSP